MHLHSKKLQDFYHLSYCSNIHPGESWAETFQNLKSYIPGIQKKIANDKEFGIGLRLSNQASIELDSGDNLSEFKTWLSEQNAYVFTMNGFPYGDFHNTCVKAGVHKPDWASEERVTYTKRLFRQLSYLLPAKGEGGISTSPLSYRHWHATEEDLSKCKKLAAENLIKIATFLYTLHSETDQYLHLDIEPEPDGVLENSQDVINFFNNELIPEGIKQFKTLFKITDEEARKIILTHITVCYDICHFALAYEEPELTLKKFRNEGIQIGKVQISSALKADFNRAELNKGDINKGCSNKASRKKIFDALQSFDELVYLHQVTGFKDQLFVAYSDISELPFDDGYSELRAHFHVPVFVNDYGLLQSTQSQARAVIQLLAEKMFTRHLEVETYTWMVLPDELKLELSASIVREMEWVIDQFNGASGDSN